MKDSLLPLLFVIVAVTGVWYFWLRTSGNRVGSAPAEETTSSAEQSIPATKAKREAHPKHSTPRAAPDDDVTASATDPDPVKAARENPALIPVAPLYKPTMLNDVKAGMTASRVVQLLGEPSLKTSTTDNGGLWESYVYSDQTHENIGVVHLRDGRVVGVPTRQ
jgi:SmpA / OmlA family